MDMENKVSYSFKERYFDLEKEKRIGKRQFQTRVFVPGILAIIPIIVVNSVVMAIFLEALKSKSEVAVTIMISSWVIMWLLPMFLYYWASLFFLPTLIKKRCHDFWSSWVTESRLFIGGFILFFSIALLLIWEFVWFIPEIIPLDILILARDYIRYGIIALGLYLMFRPGTKWKNEYGDDTSNVKIWFLG